MLKEGVFVLVGLALIGAFLLFQGHDGRNEKFESLGWQHRELKELEMSLYYPADFLDLKVENGIVKLTHKMGEAVYDCSERGFPDPNPTHRPIYDFELYIEPLLPGHIMYEEDLLENSNDKVTLVGTDRTYVMGVYGHTNCTYPYYLSLPVEDEYILGTYMYHHHRFGGPGGNPDEYWFDDLDFEEGEAINIPEEEYEEIRDAILDSVKFL